MDQRSVSSCHSLARLRTMSPLEGFSVLVIDDNRETREGMAALLNCQGMEVMLAESGQAGLRMIEDLGPYHTPDILICDIAMPGQDGYLTLSRIREWEATNDVDIPIPAIAFTASALRQERVKALSYGFNAHLTKPLVPQQLYAILGDMARLRQTLRR